MNQNVEKLADVIDIEYLRDEKAKKERARRAEMFRNGSAELIEITREIITDPAFVFVLGAIVLVLCYSTYATLSKEPGKKADPKKPIFSTATKNIIAPTDNITDTISIIEGFDPNTIDQKNVILHVKDSPLNKASLSDGLQAGDKLVIPESVQPGR